MPLLQNAKFICLDCETTGLDPEKDRIIEVAAVLFTMDEILDSFETLVNPQCPIPPESIEIHHITEDMVANQPTIDQVLPKLLKFVERNIIIGHGVQFDINIIANAAQANTIPCTLQHNPFFDTLRMARLYGKSPSNGLQVLRNHFNIAEEGAHRAMNDVIVNIQVFRHLAVDYRSTEKLNEALSRPIEMKTMPLGKHKGQLLKELPIEYLKWAATKDFDKDLIFSLQQELKRRKQGRSFNQVNLIIP